jgi:hypothetical protein
LIRIAKENLKYAELLFRQAQKRYLKSQMEIAQKNSEANAQIQVQSQQAKAESDASLNNQQNQAKEKQILLSGYFDLIKAGVQVPSDISMVLGEVIKSVAVPIAMQNQQTEMAIQEQAMQEQQAIDEGQGQVEEQEQMQMQQQV